jgi:putative ABC transport system permease protein
MVRAMLRDLLAHKGRVAMTVIAIALSVCAFVASWVVSESISHTLVNSDTRTDVGVSVQSLSGAAALSEAERARLGALPDVVRATGVRVGRAGLVGRDGKLVKAGTKPELAGTGFDGTGRFALTDGRAPAAPGEVALARSVAEAAGLHVGDRVRVLLSVGRVDTPVVVGLFRYRPLGPSSTDWESDPQPTVAYDPATASRLVSDRYNRVELVTSLGTDPALVRNEAEGVVATSGHRVWLGSELADQAARSANAATGDLRLTLLPFAVIAMLVGTTVIANTFTILVTQRTRQFALLRAVGARRSQVRRSVIVEAVVLALIGATFGTLVGIALGPLAIAVMRPADDVSYVVDPTGILIGYGAALLITVGAAYNSARRAAAVPPVAALRADQAEPRAVHIRRSVAGGVAILASLVTVFVTRDPDADTVPRIVGIAGAIVGALGVMLLTPALVGVAFRPVAALVNRYGSAALRQALRNAVRDPRRTAGTATAIMVGLGLVCAFGTLSASLATLIASTTRATLPATTTVLQPANGGGSSLDPADVDTVRALPSVTAVAASRDVLAGLRYAGGSTLRRISAIEPDALHTVLTPKITAGSADLTRGAVIAQNQADMLGLRLGDAVDLQLDPQTSVRTTVVGVYEATEMQASIFFDVALAPEGLRRQISTIYATGHDPAQARRAIDDAFRDRPDVLVTDRVGLIRQGVDTQRLAFVVMYAMFGVALVVALFGVVNTLALSVMERTREIGLVRAVGASRLLVRRSIRLESVLISLFGAVLGVVVGVWVGAVMQHAMLGQRLWSLTLPFGMIGLALCGTVLAGTLAAAWPARRAARVNVLEAIATT